MSYKTITAPTVEPVTLVEAKLHLRVDGTEEDDLITAYISAARQLAESSTQRAYAEGTYELILDAFPSGEIKLEKPPIKSVVSVKYLDAEGVEQTIDPADYVLDPYSIPGWVIPAYGVSWPSNYDSANAVRVQFTAGYSPEDVPERVKQYIKLHLTTWYENRASAGTSAFSELPGVSQLIASDKWSWF